MLNQENIGSMKEKYAIGVIVEKVQRVPLSTFEALESGDILFLDTSHVITPYGGELACGIIEC